jgi:hypothetical protein
MDPFHEGGNGYRGLISVEQHASLVDFKWKAASVNWSSIGAVTPEQAKLFAEDLLQASKIAAEWTKDLEGADCRKKKES